MGARALVSNKVTNLYRINKRTGYIETVQFVGNLRNKPIGWSTQKPTYKSVK